jgi:predicted Zn finger-like uncharacterized protein
MNNTRPLVVTGQLRPVGLATAVLQDDEQDIFRLAVCPMCHTSASVTQSAIQAGGDWRCVRCAQHWDAERLATVAAYAEWAADRERVSKRVTKGDHLAARYENAPVERPGGRT